MGLFDKIKEVQEKGKNEIKKNQERISAQTPDKVFRFSYHRTEVSIKDNIITIDFKIKSKNDENRTKTIPLDEIKAIQYKPYDNTTLGFIHFETTDNIKSYTLEDATNDNTTVVYKFKSDEEKAVQLNEYINSLNLGITFLKSSGIGDDKKIYYFESSNTKIILDDDFISITAKGISNSVLKGLTGTKNIVLDEIAGVQYKEPGFTVGYIQLVIKGSTEVKGGVFDAVDDENSITFTAREKEKALEVKEFIEKHIRNKNKPQEPVIVNTSENQFSVADEILKFKQLLDMGAITQEEFDKKKKELLNM